MRSPLLDYFGGKWRIADAIIGYFPPHKTYVEPFAGGASVFLRKSPAKNEIVNDIDQEIVNVFRVMRSNSAELLRVLTHTPYSRYEYHLSKEPTDDPIEKARRTLIRSHMGIGDSINQTSGFRAKVAQNGPAVGSWRNLIHYFDEYLRRMRNCIIENLPYEQCIERYDRGPGVLFYFDPPYLKSTRRKGAYRFDWKTEDHEKFLERVSKIKSKVIISGYSSDLYNEALKGWKISQIYTRSQRNVAVECLWRNFGGDR